MLPSNFRQGLHASDPANLSYEKMTSQPTFFCCTYSRSPKVSSIYTGFLIWRLIQTHILTYFWKIKACVGVIYFLVCVGKYESNLPTNIHTTMGKKTQWYRYVESVTLWVKPHSCLIFYDNVVRFLLPKCVFFYQWCLSGLSSQHYVSMIFVKQY